MPRPPFGLPHLCIDSHLCRCICASTAICAVASVHRQPFVPLHRATALCGCLYASLHNGFVRPPSCILCTFMNALLVSHRASSAVWVATSVHRQPFVPLHLCIDSHLCRCICAMTAICAVASCNGSVWLSLCILA